jgi:hypothetical protein
MSGMFEVPPAAEVYQACSEAGALPLADVMIAHRFDRWRVRFTLEAVLELIDEHPDLRHFVVHHYRRLLARDERARATGGSRS